MPSLSNRFLNLWTLLNRWKWLLLGILSCVALLQTAAGSVPSQSGVGVDLEQQIRQLRTGEVVIQVVDQAGMLIRDAEIQLSQTAHQFPFGVALSSKMFSPDVNPTEQIRYLDIAQQFFNASVHENALKWYATEPERGQVSYATADQILDWSEQHHLPLRGHNLFWAVERWNPEWLKSLSIEELYQAVKQRTEQVCHRYRGRIREYDVLNEMLNGDFFQQRLGDGIVKEMFLWCRSADPDATLYTNEFGILTGEQLQPYIDLVQSLRADGVPVGGIGIQAHIRSPITSTQIQHSLDQLATLGLPLKITEFSVIAPTPAQEAQTLREVYRTAFAHPAVTGIYMWGFWEGAVWEQESAIFQRDFTPLPAAEAYQNLIYGDWWTEAKAVSDGNGSWSTRAFFGDYHLSVKAGSLAGEQSFSFTSDSVPQVITVVMAPMPD